MQHFVQHNSEMLGRLATMFKSPNVMCSAAGRDLLEIKNKPTFHSTFLSFSNVQWNGDPNNEHRQT